MAERDFFNAAFHALCQEDQDKFRQDIAILGTAFIKVDRDGKVTMIEPSEIYKDPKNAN